MTENEVLQKIDFINRFIQAANPASGSTVDANANVTNKTLATLEAELYKPETIKINRKMIKDRIEGLYGPEMAEIYLQDIESHKIYVHDETSLKPYCASITLYPFLMEGTKPLGGTSRAPKNLQSFCGSFSNLIYQVASDFAGAVATVEFLMYFDYFARKDYGDDYLASNIKEIRQNLQHVVYTMNQPAAARGNQSVFWNISVFDQTYFNELFGEFYFPDGSQPCWSTVSKLQDYFLYWFREERTKEVLTFPVLTAAYVVDKETKKPLDLFFTDTLALNMSLGLSFFHYESDSADSLASCCRLRNEFADNQFSYTLGAGGVSTGSFQVITLNLNRIFQDQMMVQESDCLSDIVYRVQCYLAAFRTLVEEYIDCGLLKSYEKGFISLEKQFGTIGINGALEAYESCFEGSELSYADFLKAVLGDIKAINVLGHKNFGFRFNTEFVPAENLGIKNAKWDKEDGYIVPRDCYNSYFFAVEDESMTCLDRLALHGADISQYLDGGAACHLNLEQVPSFKQALQLIYSACEMGVPYWTTNVLCTICNDCGRISPDTRRTCRYCESTNLDYGTRIIGYLKPISSFSEGRQKEALKRHYMKG